MNGDNRDTEWHPFYVSCPDTPAGVETYEIDFDDLRQAQKFASDVAAVAGITCKVFNTDTNEVLASFYPEEDGF